MIHRLHQQRDEFVIDLFRKAVERWSGKELTDEMIGLVRSKSYLQRGVWTGEEGRLGYGIPR